MRPDWGRIKESDTTDEFVAKQGIIYIVCPNHLNGIEYIRYIVVGHIWIDDPMPLHFKRVNDAFPNVERHFVESHCPLCRRIHESLPRFADVVSVRARNHRS